ncbi:type II secretion system F family protein [Alkalihalophilus lindianensis]|uniref:Type II secretion system F family protein n=1 Tax=Alkalihalophilus lindianensis TaxID=1630542 RepID=A0ABU3XAG9_9BACI|nr:type II secretion system F family protein [Alkalihalophilus lindianensis]MDV2684892.1 type II secretion system F family protein [Alkalihalophilus lindianensis]
MAIYRYTGRDRKGQVKNGKVKAPSEKQARLLLREDGIVVRSLGESTSLLDRDILLGGKGVRSQDFVIYLRQFATLLKAGISVVDATVILRDQTTSKKLKSALFEVEEELRAGNPFSFAAENQKKVFPPLFVNMAKAGELGGNLDDILERLASYYEKQHKTKQKVMSAMSYPLVVGFVAIIIVIFLLSYVVPTFADMFTSFDSELPLITLFVLQAGEFFSRIWWMLPFVVILFSVFLRMVNERAELRYYRDLFILRVPIFGKLLQKAALARMTRTLSSLFASSVPVLQAVSIVERIVGNEVIARVIKESRNSLERGESIAAPMHKHWVFPPLVTQMIAVGEKTGSLDTMLDKVADFYESEVEAGTDQIKSLIEPLMIVILAFVVGIIVAAIAIPMFEIFDAVG